MCVCVRACVLAWKATCTNTLVVSVASRFLRDGVNSSMRNWFWINSCPSLRLVANQGWREERIDSSLSQGHLRERECNEFDWNSNSVTGFLVLRRWPNTSPAHSLCRISCTKIKILLKWEIIFNDCAAKISHAIRLCAIYVKKR